MYKDFALVYDRLMDFIDYDRWAEIFEELLGNKKKVLEFGCGTGSLTYRLKEKGFQIEGVDISSDMLSLAEQKFRERKLSIPLFKGDMKDFMSNHTYDAVICVCDSFNYLENLEAIRSFFRTVYRCLDKEGLFLFDIKTKETFDRMESDIFIFDQKDLYCVWEIERDGNVYHYDLTFFVEENGVYERYDESQQQYYYSTEIIKELLEEVGFKDIEELLILNEDPINDPERLLLFSKKIE